MKNSTAQRGQSNLKEKYKLKMEYFGIARNVLNVTIDVKIVMNEYTDINIGL